MKTQYDDFVKQVASVASLADMAERCGLEVERSRGRRLITLCPYHDDHRPSLHLYEKNDTTARDQFHCFACGAHGDVFTLVETLRSVDFWQAATWVGEQYGISVPRGRRGKRPAKPPRLRGLEEALAIYQSQSEAEIRQQKSIADARRFEHEFLTKAEVYFARGNKISSSVNEDDEREQVEALREAGVIRRREPKYSPHESSHLKIPFPLKDLFLDDRLVFAIRNENSELVGFAGRQYTPDHGPKYLFTESFPRRSTLYGLNRVFEAARLLKPPRASKKASKSEDTPVFHLFIVEGVFDVLRLESLRLSAAAILGSRLTNEQAVLIGKIANEVDRREWQLAVHLFLDDDDAGRDGTSAAIPRLLSIAAGGTAFGLDVIVPTQQAPLASPLKV